MKGAYEGSALLCRRCLEEPVNLQELAHYLDEYASTLPDAIRASAEDYEARLSACAACPKRVSFTCTLCGCYVQARAAKKEQRCPWPGAARW